MGLFERGIKLLLKNRRVEQLPIEWSEVRRIAVFSNTAIGDTLFSTPIFRILKNRFPEKELIAVLNPSNYQLFATNPHLDRILLYDGRTRTFPRAVRELKQLRPEVVVIGHSNEPQATPLALLSGARYIIKTPNHLNPFRKFHSHPPVKPIPDKHGIFSRLEGLRLAGVEWKKREVVPELFLKEEWKEQAREAVEAWKSSGKLVGFQVGASTPSRRWYPERWAELGKILLDRHPDLTIALLGGPADRQLGDEVERRLHSHRVVNWVGRFPLPVAAAILGELDLLITPDTGPLHIAATLGTPTLALYVVASPFNTNPFWEPAKHPFIYKPRPCFRCIAKRCPVPFCMLQITVSEVAEKAEPFLL